MYFTIRPRDQYLGPDCLGMSTTEIVDCYFVPCHLQFEEIFTNFFIFHKKILTTISFRFFFVQYIAWDIQNNAFYKVF